MAISEYEEYTVDPSGTLTFRVRTRPSPQNPEVPETSVAGSYYCEASLVGGGPVVTSEKVTLTLACMPCAPLPAFFVIRVEFLSFLRAYYVLRRLEVLTLADIACLIGL